MVAIITVPYIKNEQHYKQARTAYLSFKKQFGVKVLKIAVINHCEEYLSFIEKNNDIVIHNDENCLSRAWNKGIKEAIKNGCELFYIPNLDINLHPQGLKGLVDAQEETNAGIVGSSAVDNPNVYMIRPDNKYTDIQHGDQSFSSFLLTKQAYEEIGEFDEQFKPCYYEDNDYLHRARIKNVKCIRTFKSLFYHDVQGTVKTLGEEHWNNVYLKFLNENKQKYISKWGGDVGNENK